MLLLPRTTACFPLRSIPVSWRSAITPFGVQGMKMGFPPRFASSPMLFVPKPSTSFSSATAEVMLYSEMAWGRGNWTRIPCTAGSLLRRFRVSRSSVSVTCWGKGRSSQSMLAWELLVFS